jgi:hypothetical protein
MIPESQETPGLLGRFLSSIFGNSFSAGQPENIKIDKSSGLVYRADQDRYDQLIENPYNLQTLTYSEDLKSPLIKFHNASAIDSVSPSFKFSVYNPEAVSQMSTTYQSSETITFKSGGVGLFDKKSYGKFLDALENDGNSFILKFRRKWREPSVLTVTKGNLGIEHTKNYNELNRLWLNSRFSGIQKENVYGEDSVMEPGRSLNLNETGIPSQTNKNADTAYEKKIITSETEQNSRLERFFNSMIEGNLSNTTQQLKGSKNKLILNRYPVHHNNEQFIKDLNQKMTDQFGDGSIADGITGYPVNPTKPTFYGLKNISSGDGKWEIERERTSKITGKAIDDYTRYNMGIYGVKALNENDNIRKDSLNLLGVVDADKIDSLRKQNVDPTRDIIKFSFLDVVNNKIAFFRATLKSISDQATPEWSDIRYLGRADKVYVYNGLTRSISFNFRVYATSRSEMWPMWQRINYLYGMAYPSNIIRYDGYGINLPPFVKMTVGNLYTSQPILLNSIGLTIPDEASWEIDQGQQFPMMVDISVTTTFLEQEEPRINSSHFDIPNNLNIKINIGDVITDNSEALALNDLPNQPNLGDQLESSGDGGPTFVT